MWRDIPSCKTYKYLSFFVRILRLKINPHSGDDADITIVDVAVVMSVTIAGY